LPSFKLSKEYIMTDETPDTMTFKLTEGQEPRPPLPENVVAGEFGKPRPPKVDGKGPEQPAEKFKRGDWVRFYHNTPEGLATLIIAQVEYIQQTPKGNVLCTGIGGIPEAAVLEYRRV
jgi:hypothetical protein